MDFWGTLLVLVRRWYVAVPVFLLVAGATAGVYLSVPTQYMSGSVLALTAPLNGGTVSPKPKNVSHTNPLLNFTRGNRTTATLLVEALNTPDIAAEVTRTLGTDTTVRVLNGAGNTEMLDTGPYLLVQGQSTSRVKAQEVVANTVALAHERLAALQAVVRAPPATYLTLTEVVAPTEPTAVKTTRTRSAISALAVGTVLSVASAYVAESAMLARRRRRRRWEASAAFGPEVLDELDDRELLAASNTGQVER